VADRDRLIAHLQHSGLPGAWRNGSRW
jgi:hypothetical protein